MGDSSIHNPPNHSTLNCSSGVHLDWWWDKWHLHSFNPSFICYIGEIWQLFILAIYFICTWNLFSEVVVLLCLVLLEQLQSQASFWDPLLGHVTRATAGPEAWNWFFQLESTFQIDCPLDERLSFTQDLRQGHGIAWLHITEQGLSPPVRAWRPQGWRSRVRVGNHRPWVTRDILPTPPTLDAWRSLLQDNRGRQG